MTEEKKPNEDFMRDLTERAKELACFYRVDEILNHQNTPTDEIFRELIQALPAGWQYPDHSQARLTLDASIFEPPGFRTSPWALKAPIVLEGETVGELEVCYTEEKPAEDEGPFLKEERKLINTIAERIAYFLLQRRRGDDLLTEKSAVQVTSPKEDGQWRVILDFLRHTDPSLLVRITRKMINDLHWRGVAEAHTLLRDFTPGLEDYLQEDNRPRQRETIADFAKLAESTFLIAAKNLPEDELASRIHNWIRESKVVFLVDTVAHLDVALGDITSVLERFRNTTVDEKELPISVQTELKVSLLRRFLSDQIDYINIAKKFVAVSDFYDLSQRVIGLPTSRGKLGGKSAGLHLACQIIKKSPEYAEKLGHIKMPRTWYITSDTLLEFIHYNNLDDVYSSKYKDIGQVRQDYPQTVQLFKNSHFPPEVTTGLALVLDELANQPLIVRSSSLLEDRSGATFSGKYKSLFLANQGSKKQRLEELLDAIAEVYASIFNPDVIEYRAERGLLDVHEEMGIMIQEVVGTRIGEYFLPAFSGVAFSNNEFRWSPRIRREDGLLRLVPGLGTRAVDRLTDDYPVLISPGQPNLRTNTTSDEIIRYSPKKIDVINLDSNSFDTVLIRDLLRDHGEEYPLTKSIVSIVDFDHIRQPMGLGPDFQKDELIVTFDRLIADSPFVTQMKDLLMALRETIGKPIDIEFASDGTHIYLLQCRPQSYSEDAAPTPIPRNLPRDKILFSANRNISNGRVSNITHIVYVDPAGYQNLTEVSHLREVGRAVGRLNAILPKRQFILMGPGRWGSRGDIKLGVSVTYSDINNTALLIEIARQKGNYVPELSFGTHFFQDLVEAGIRYLPLYPDEKETLFNELFFTRSKNLLSELLPELSHLTDTVRVIDVQREAQNQVCHILMNAELDEAVGVLAEPASSVEESPRSDFLETQPEDHWRWRLRMAEKIASELDADRFGVTALYLFGGVKNAIAGPGSDIDLLVHFGGDERKRKDLLFWLEGWSLSLSEINYLRTGYETEGLLDVHILTDEDIARQNSYAAKINAVTDAARLLLMKKSEP